MAADSETQGNESWGPSLYTFHRKKRSMEFIAFKVFERSRLWQSLVFKNLLEVQEETLSALTSEIFQQSCF